MLRALLAASDRLSLMTRREMQVDAGGGSLAVLDFDPDVSRSFDGIAMRSDWVPTRMQSHFIDILRANSASG